MYIYRDETEYEKNLVFKTFFIQFINSYTTLYYIAFGKNLIILNDKCLNLNCMLQLKFTVGTLFITFIFLDVLISLIYPQILQYNRYIHYYAGIQTSENPSECNLEKEYCLSEYNNYLAIFAQYNNDCIHFGFISMFVTAFPMAALMFCIMTYLITR